MTESRQEAGLLPFHSVDLEGLMVQAKTQHLFQEKGVTLPIGLC